MCASLYYEIDGRAGSPVLLTMGMGAQELALAARRRVRSLALIATQAGGALGWPPPRRGVQLVTQLATARGRARIRALRQADSDAMGPRSGLLVAPGASTTTRSRSRR